MERSTFLSKSNQMLQHRGEFSNSREWQSQGIRMPVAFVGKVYFKVDAQYTLIEVGDLLTISPTPGHVMRADDPQKAFGVVLGKALKPREGRQGLIPILIALQ